MLVGCNGSRRFPYVLQTGAYYFLCRQHQPPGVSVISLSNVLSWFSFWMHAILKAKFCHTAHTVLSKSATPEKGSGPAELPDLSNKAQRLADLLHPKSVSGEAAVGAHHENKITNIDIKNIGMGNPEVGPFSHPKCIAS